MRKFMYLILAVLAVVFLASYVVLSQSRFGKLPDGDRMERIKHSPNFRDGEFQNQSHTPTFTGETTRLKVMTDFFFKKKVRVTPVDTIPHIKTDLNALNPDNDVMVWFGHSSYFMQIDGRKIIVDPVFSNYAAPFPWMVKAFPGTSFYSAADMPFIDYLFITHDHWDHLDYKTMVAMKPKVKKVFCGLGVGAHLENWGFHPDSIVEMDWYDQSVPDTSWVVNATPARHFSGRALKRNQTLWVSFALQTPSLNIFIGGDSGYDKHFAETGSKLGPFDLVFLEQGQYNEHWKFIHLMPSELFKAAGDLKAKRIMPVHNSRFALSVHPWDEPLKEAAANSAKYGIPVITPVIGEPVNLNDTTRVFTSWWSSLK